MQFTTPNIALLSGDELEMYVAAIFQTNGYYVMSDLWWSEASTINSFKSIDILQADVLAYFFTPFSVNSILVECKGGGTFVDFFKFLGIAEFLNASSSFFICSNSPVFDELIKLGENKGIKVFTPKNIIDSFSSSINYQKIDQWYWSNSL